MHKQHASIRFLRIQIRHQFSFLKHFLMLMSDNFAWQRCQAIGTEHLHEHVPIYGLQRVTDGYFSTPEFSRGILLIYSLHATAKSYILTELDLQDLDVCMYSWTVNDAVYRCIFAMEFAPFIHIICCTILITFLIYVLHNLTTIAGPWYFWQGSCTSKAHKPVTLSGNATFTKV